jgi:hypothetical protein
MNAMTLRQVVTVAPVKNLCGLNENSSHTVSAICSNDFVKELQYSEDGYYLNLTDSDTVDSDPSQSPAVFDSEFATAVEAALRLKFRAVSVVCVEKDTTLTARALIADRMETERTLKASLGDWLVVRGRVDGKFSECPNRRDLLKHCFVIEIQSGNKSMEQSMAQLFLTIHVHLRAGTVGTPVYGAVIARDDDQGPYCIRPVKVGTDFSCLNNGTYLLTSRNLAMIVLAAWHDPSP